MSTVDILNEVVLQDFWNFFSLVRLMTEVCGVVNWLDGWWFYLACTISIRSQQSSLETSNSQTGFYEQQSTHERIERVKRIKFSAAARMNFVSKQLKLRRNPGKGLKDSSQTYPLLISPFFSFLQSYNLRAIM